MSCLRWILGLALVLSLVVPSHAVRIVGSGGSPVTVDCDDSAGQHLNYDQQTGLFVCGSSTQGAATISVPNNTVTTITSTTIANNTTAAVALWYKAEVWNGTDLQIEMGVATCQVTNKAGTIANNSCTKALNIAPGQTAGTLQPVEWTITAANPALVQVKVNSSLTPTATWPKVTYARIDGTQSVGGAPGNALADGATKGIVAFPSTDMICASGICALKGTLAPSPLTWNVTAAACFNDGNRGKLTVTASNQIQCDADEGTGADVTSNASIAVINEIAVFADTSGKTIGRANLTGVLKATAGVLSAAGVGDYVAPARSLSTTAPLSGGGDLSANRTFSCPTCTTNAAALTSGFPVMGGGSNAVAIATKSGTTTEFGTTTGTKTTNKQLAFDAGGNIIASGTDIGGVSVDAVADGSTKGVAAFTAADFNSASGVISLDYTNAQAASSSTKGFLIAADWTTFNAKVGTARLLNTTAPLGGGGDLSADRTLTCPTCTTNASALTANLPVIGVGSNATAVGTRSGTTTEFATSTGTKTTGKQLQFDASGNVVASGTDIGGSSADAAADGTTKGIATYAAADFNSSAGVISLDYANGQAATDSVPGFLSAVDHASFAAKVATTRAINTSSPLGGGGNLSADRTLTCTTCTTNAAALTANLPVIGGGGQATAVGTRSGNTTAFGTVTGTLTTGKQLQFDSSGNIVASATDIGGGGGGGLGDPGGNGYVVRTSTNTTINRTIQGTSAHITVTNGDGQAGNTTLNTGASVVLTDAVNTFSGAGALTGLPTPGNASDVATKGYVDTVAAGIAPHTAARMATTANLTATYSNGASGVGATLTNAGTQAAFAVDGITGVASDRVLIKNQTTDFQNGIYTVTTVGTGSTNWVLTRATDYDTTAEVVGGSQLLVSAGTANAGSLWVMTNAASITMGTTSITFTQLLVAPYTLALTGDVTGSGSQTVTTTLANIPTGVPMAGNIFSTTSAAPSTPSSGHTYLWADSTDKRFHDKIEGSGTIGTTVVADTGASNNFLTAISAAGVISKAQPSAANLSNGVTGSGAVALQDAPTFTVPALGVASATTLNKYTFTTPATGATLTIANGKTLTVSNTLTFTGTDASSIAFGAGGTAVYEARTLTTSSPLGGGGDLSANRTLTCATCTTNAAALTANLPVIGGGGQATAVGTKSGTTTEFGTTTGTKTTNKQLAFDAGGNIVASAVDIGNTSSDAAADGVTKGIATFLAADFNAASGVISLDYTNAQAASASLKGFLTATDWSTFNTKVSATRAVNTTSPLSGGGDLSGDRTLTIATAVANGTTKGAATFLAADFNDDGSGLISLDYTNGQTANASTKGFLTSADWNTFNGKQDTITWGAGLTVSGATASVASTEPNFLTNGVATDLTAGASQGGKMQVMQNGELQYTDGASTPALRKGLLTQSGLTWNVTTATCTSDGNLGKLTIIGTEIRCSPDVGGGTITAGTNGNATYYTGTNSVDDSTGMTFSSNRVLTLYPNVTSLVNSNLTLGAHHTIACSAGPSDRTLTLPAANGATTGYYKVVKVDSGVGACKVTRAGSDTINGVAGTADAVTQWSTVEVQLIDSGSPGNWAAVFGTTAFLPNPQTGTYQATNADFSAYRTITVASGTFTITLVASGTQPTAGQHIRVINYGTGLVTIARSGQNINGATTSLTLSAASGQAPASAFIVSDGTNYLADVNGPSPTKRVLTLTSSTTYAPTTDTDQVEMAMTGGAGTLTVNAPTGTTPVNGQLLLLGFLCTNSQTFSWNSIYIPSPNISTPSVCPADVTKWFSVGAKYSSVLTKWQIIATN